MNHMVIIPASCLQKLNQSQATALTFCRNRWRCLCCQDQGTNSNISWKIDVHNLTVPHEGPCHKNSFLHHEQKVSACKLWRHLSWACRCEQSWTTMTHSAIPQVTNLENKSNNIHSCQIKMTVSFAMVLYWKKHFTASGIGLLFLFQRFQTTSQFSKSPFNMQLPWKQNAQFETSKKNECPPKNRYELLFYRVADVSATNTVRPNFE